MATKIKKTKRLAQTWDEKQVLRIDKLADKLGLDQASAIKFAVTEALEKRGL